MLEAQARANGWSGAEAAPVHLSINNLTKRFGSFVALDAVSLDIFRGELVCFLGPSGCGKTTLLRAIAGLDIQDEGSINLAGRDVSGLPPAQRDFGIVFQSYALFPNLSVADNVGYGLVNQRWPKAKRIERVAELLALVGLADQAKKFPVQLSGGQQQRIALARALATSPSLLLLDEPLSALDARVRVRLREEIKSLQRRLGVTTILVTHDQEEALAMADRIVVMNHGMIDQVGSPAEVYGRPKTAFVADFIGTMTFLEGEVTTPGLVRVSGIDISSDHAGGAIGAKVLVGFRPEEVQVRGLTGSTPNRLQAHVESLEYLGPFCRGKLTAGGMNITADFSSNAMTDLRIEAGQTISVALPPSAMRIFPLQCDGMK